jgi:hypothetical protein
MNCSVVAAVLSVFAGLELLSSRTGLFFSEHFARWMYEQSLAGMYTLWLVSDHSDVPC